MPTVVKVFLTIGGIALVLVAMLHGYHRLRLEWEANNIPIPGQLVQVDGYGVHVFAAGSGAETLVFLAGSGTSGPTTDFKPLWSRLTATHRIVVVERPGYGFSQRAQGLNRDLPTMLSETRRALQLAGETGPYVLVPHSMAVLEALYWSHQYPDEVRAIVALDPAVPATYEAMSLPPVWALQFMSHLASLGITRLLPLDRKFLKQQRTVLSQYDQALYSAALHRSTLTSNMLDELKRVKDNAGAVGALGPPPGIPVLFFIAHGSGMETSQWQNMLVTYARTLENGQYEQMDAGHYVHHDKPERIAQRLTSFLESVPAGVSQPPDCDGRDGCGRPEIDG